MLTKGEIKALSNEIMDLIIHTSTEDVCIECQKEILIGLLEERLFKKG